MYAGSTPDDESEEAMAKVTSGFGVFLAVVGVMGYLLTTDQTPFWLGIALVVCGVLGDSESQRRRMIWMHIAVVVGLMGVVVPGKDAARVLLRIYRHGGVAPWPEMLRFHEVAAVLSLVYVLVCVGSFLAARLRPGLGEPLRA
jgi:hypothetical protein